MTAAGGSLLLNGLLIAGLLTLAGPQSAREQVRPIEVALIRPEPAPVVETPAPTPPEPEPIAKAPEPAPVSNDPPPPPPPPPQITPEPPKPKPRVVRKPAPAPVAAARPVDEPRPSSITAEPAPPSTPVAPTVTEAPPSAPPPVAIAPPVKVGPRIDASWTGNSPPPYPAVARRMGEQGEVRLDVHVDADGTVSDVRLKQSSGSDTLDRTAVDTVRKWRFKPATVDGRPVSEWYHNWKWVFRLES